MTFGALLILAFALAMDAMAVSAARGLATPRIEGRDVLLIAGFFGGFQSLMLGIGWAMGSRVGPFVQAWDHWVAFVLLGGIGTKMLWESRKTQLSDWVEGDTTDLFQFKVLLVLAVATSVDALAAGITLPMLNAPLVLSLTTIGVAAAVLSVLGLFLGHRFGALLGRRLDAVGGVILMFLGSKILFEHLHNQ